MWKQLCTGLILNGYEIVEASLIFYMICPANDSVVRSLSMIPKLGFGLVSTRSFASVGEKKKTAFSLSSGSVSGVG